MFTAQLLKTPQSSQESSAKGRFEETFPQADTIAEMHCMRCPEPAATSPRSWADARRDAGLGEPRILDDLSSLDDDDDSESR